MTMSQESWYELWIIIDENKNFRMKNKNNMLNI